MKTISGILFDTKEAHSLRQSKTMSLHGHSSYLFVHSIHDGGADLYPQQKAALEVLLQAQGLHNGHQQEQQWIDVPLPDIAGFVLSEGDHLSGKRK